MGPVNTELESRARSIFSQLGYTVVGDGPEFRAERDWKVVRVTATGADAEVPDAGSLRCFVTASEHAPELRRELTRSDPDYEWAIIGVDDDDYEVERAPPGPHAVT